MRAALMLIVLLGCGMGRAGGADLADERARLAAVAQPLIDKKKAQSMVVGLIDPGGGRVYAFGKLSPDANSKAPDGRTVYEIASLTKTFSAALVAEMSLRKEIKLDDPVSDYLPKTVKMPAGKPITMMMLVTHHSGLPRMPTNFKPKDAGNPFADYDSARMYDFLAEVKLHEPEKYEYSNIGYALLGHAMSRRAGKSYEALLNERVTGPLGLKDTTIALNEDQKARLAPPFDAKGKADRNWDFADLPAGGALRSTVDDMLVYLSAQIAAGDGVPAEKLKLPETLVAAMALTHVERDTLAGKGKMAMGWHVAISGQRNHNGQTGGYHTYLSFDPKTKTGVVVLANTATGEIDKVGEAAVGMVGAGR